MNCLPSTAADGKSDSGSPRSGNTHLIFPLSNDFDIYEFI